MKKCQLCKGNKEKSEFWQNQPYCKSCSLSYYGAKYKPKKRPILELPVNAKQFLNSYEYLAYQVYMRYGSARSVSRETGIRREEIRRVIAQVKIKIEKHKTFLA